MKFFGSSKKALSKRGGIPPLIVQTLDFLREQQCWKSVGIFRLSGDQSMIRNIKTLFDKGKKVDFGAYPRLDVHAAAGLLKLYLRELPDPICTFELYPAFLQAIDIVLERNGEGAVCVDAVRQVLDALPVANRDVLFAVIDLLHKIHLTSDENKMHSVNLAIVIGPNILRADVGPIEALADMQRVISVVELLIANWNELKLISPALTGDKAAPAADPTHVRQHSTNAPFPFSPLTAPLLPQIVSLRLPTTEVSARYVDEEQKKLLVDEVQWDESPDGASRADEFDDVLQIGQQPHAAEESLPRKSFGRPRRARRSVLPPPVLVTDSAPADAQSATSATSDAQANADAAADDDDAVQRLKVLVRRGTNRLLQRQAAPSDTESDEDLASLSDSSDDDDGRTTFQQKLVAPAPPTLLVVAAAPMDVNVARAKPIALPAAAVGASRAATTPSSVPLTAAVVAPPSLPSKQSAASLQRASLVGNQLVLLSSSSADTAPRKSQTTTVAGGAPVATPPDKAVVESLIASAKAAPTRPERSAGDDRPLGASPVPIVPAKPARLISDLPPSVPDKPTLLISDKKPPLPVKELAAEAIVEPPVTGNYLKLQSLLLRIRQEPVTLARALDMAEAGRMIPATIAAACDLTTALLAECDSQVALVHAIGLRAEQEQVLRELQLLVELAACQLLL